MNDLELKLILEALLMNSNRPIPLEKLHTLISQEDLSIQRLQAILRDLAQDYAHRSIDLKENAGGFCFQTRASYSAWVCRLYEEKPPKFSSALLETLAIIAYKQPVSRADIEDIRGVAVSSSMLKTLLEREWIRVAGHRDIPGKPAVYTTTKHFLDYFNLQSLNELPDIMTEIPEEFSNKIIEQTTDEIEM
jgi:segregation and condensation protein B